MNFVLEFDPRALTEIKAAAAEYEAVRPGHRVLYLSDIDYVVELLTTVPKFCQRVDGEVRRASLRRFPYHLYYRVDETVGRVHVIGCKPDRADPATVLADIAARFFR